MTSRASIFHLAVYPINSRNFSVSSGLGIVSPALMIRGGERRFDSGGGRLRRRGMLDLMLQRKIMGMNGVIDVGMLLVREGLLARTRKYSHARRNVLIEGWIVGNLDRRLW
jgi:hypothetical protein